MNYFNLFNYFITFLFLCKIDSSFLHLYYKIRVIIIVQLMRNNIAFKISAQNSLRINEITQKQQKNMLNTFKAGSDLRTQLGKVKPMTKNIRVGGNDTFEKQQKKAEDQVLAQQVAALDHYKAPLTRQKTKNLIQNIKLRRRQKHIDALSSFKDDSQQYKQTLKMAYQSLVNDIDQVMSIKTSNIEQYLSNCNKKEYLLSQEKQIIAQTKEHIMNYQIQCENKLNSAKQELNRINKDRTEVAIQICSNLCATLMQIAFILQPEAKQLQKKQHEELSKVTQKYFQQFWAKLQAITEKQKQTMKTVENLQNQLINNWKTVKQEDQIQKYIQAAQSDTLRRNHSIRATFDRLIEEQMLNHERKIKKLNDLINEDPDSLSKVNLDRFGEAVKKINDHFDNVLDEILSEFKQANNDNKNQNQKRLQHCRNRLVYIQKHNSEQIQKILDQKCTPLCKRNIQQQEQLIKKSTNYAENQDDKQNKIIESISKFIMKIGLQNDNFVKEFGNLNQKYEIQKAKILDDDEQLVQKLNEELLKLKVQLKQALHHIKLEQVEAKCFQKVDQIQNAYRNCHERNKALKSTRTPSLQQFMKKYEAKLAEIMELFSPLKRAELQQKNKKQCQQQALKRIESEDKKKAEQEQRLIQQAKAKGGKPPPPPKPKDPKKAAAELEQRKKVILAEMGPKKIEEIKTDAGSVWLVFKSITEICQSFYRQVNKQIQQAKGQPQKIEQKVKALDVAQEPIKDCRNAPVVNQKSFIKLAQIIPLLQTLRTKTFQVVSQKKVRIINESENLDEQMIQQSLINLDNRLKAHYSLKGKIQSEIFVKRSGQITGHKKKYQKYARTVKQKIDLQTQKFNFLLEKGLQSLKSHIAEQKGLKQHISKCKNLSQLQGMYSRMRQNFNIFGLNIKQIINELERFSTAQIEALLKKNEQFIKQSKLMKDGGDYSNDEIAWYEQMMSQITNQMKDQKQKRQLKTKQLKEHSDKRKQELLESFQKQYNVAIQQLAARDGTGKKYGRPKRIAQQKTRLQMNKCEQAQMNINNMINDLKKLYQKEAQKNFHHETFPDLLAWRQKLMALQFCIMRYSKHIEALRTDLKINPMIRVNYNLKSPEAKLLPQEQQQDKKRKQEELKGLGRLSQQKDEKVFIKYIEDIEKLISDESRTIYVGDKAKFLTGTDKIPDFLRTYIVNMKKSAEAFRVSCVRDLRESCMRLSDLSANMSDLFFYSLLSYYQNGQIANKNKIIKVFLQFSEKNKKQRVINMQKLRPNLLNPKCQDQLKELDKTQKNRNDDYIKSNETINKDFKDIMFKNGEEFLSCLLNNYQFLLLYIDSLFLTEDFIKLPGDEIQQKIHLQTQKLIIMKQKGIKIDPNSERNLRKKWEGLDFSIFNIQNRKFEYKKADQAPKQKDKKGGKKDTKDPKKQEEVQQDSDPSKSKVIETFKTWRQKSVFQARQSVRASFKTDFDKVLAETLQKIEVDKKENMVHQKKWRQVADSLYIK